MYINNFSKFGRLKSFGYGNHINATAPVVMPKSAPLVVRNNLLIIWWIMVHKIFGGVHVRART